MKTEQKYTKKLESFLESFIKDAAEDGLDREDINKILENNTFETEHIEDVFFDVFESGTDIEPEGESIEDEVDSLNDDEI